MTKLWEMIRVTELICSLRCAADRFSQEQFESCTTSSKEKKQLFGGKSSQTTRAGGLHLFPVIWDVRETSHMNPNCQGRRT